MDQIAGSGVWLTYRNLAAFLSFLVVQLILVLWLLYLIWRCSCLKAEAEWDRDHHFRQLQEMRENHAKEKSDAYFDGLRDGRFGFR